jgi:hypothetical protein
MHKDIIKEPLIGKMYITGKKTEEYLNNLVNLI